ncbi:MAG: hypothetical protein AAGG50_08285 [Bacteroidota bacterium]
MGRLLLLLFLATALSANLMFQRGAKAVGQASGERLSEHQVTTLAAEAAQAGLVEAQQYLRTTGANATSSSFQGAFNGGQYATDVTVVPGSRWVTIRSEGSYTLPNGERGRHVKELALRGQSALGLGGAPPTPPTAAAGSATPPGSLPEFMEGAVVTAEQMFSLHNGFAVRGGGHNANIRTNGDAQSSTASVEGFLLHAEPVIDPAIRAGLEGILAPPVNPDGLPLLLEVPPVVIPEFRAADHRTAATDSFATDVHLSGTYLLGTPTAPAIWFIDGDLNTHAATTFSGYGIFLVEGNANFNHPVTNLTAGATESHLAIYTTGDLSVNASATLQAQLFANGNLNFGGSSRVIGSLVTRGTLNINGANPTVDAQAPSPSLTAPIWPLAAASAPASSPPPAPTSVFVYEPVRSRQWSVAPDAQTGAAP